MTVNVSNHGAVTLRKSDGTEFATGELPSGLMIEITFHQSQFISDVDPGEHELTENQATSSGNSTFGLTSGERLSQAVAAFESDPSLFKVDATDVGGTADAITLANVGVSALSEGLRVGFFVETENTGAVTLRVDSLSIVSLRKSDDSEFASGALEVGRYVVAQYSATNSRFVSDVDPAGSGSGISTVSTDATLDGDGTIKRSVRGCRWRCGYHTTCG